MVDEERQFTNETVEQFKQDPRLAEQGFKAGGHPYKTHYFTNGMVDIEIKPAMGWSRILPDQVKVRVEARGHARGVRPVVYTIKRRGDLAKSFDNIFKKAAERTKELVGRERRKAAEAQESAERQGRLRQVILTRLTGFEPRFLSGDYGVRAERGDIKFLVSEQSEGYSVEVKRLPYLTLEQAGRLAALVAEFESASDAPE